MKGFVKHFLFSWSVFELVLLLFEREPTDGIGSPPIELRITQSYP